MYTALFHVFNNPTVLDRLRAEVDQAWDKDEENMSLKSLECLPYLVRLILP